MKTGTHRAWVWQDDGSVYGIAKAFSGLDIHWMIAYSNRRKGDPMSDLQEKRKSLLEDPDDTWRPGDDDYADLLAEHDDGFTERNAEAIREAVERAAQELNTVIDIASEVEGNVVQEHDQDEVEGAVIEETSERWLLLAKKRRGGRRLTFEDAKALAAAGYPDEVFPDLVEQVHNIRGDLLTADPSTHYVFYAELP